MTKQIEYPSNMLCCRIPYCFHMQPPQTSFHCLHSHIHIYIFSFPTKISFRVKVNMCVAIVAFSRRCVNIYQLPQKMLHHGSNRPMSATAQFLIQKIKRERKANECNLMSLREAFSCVGVMGKGGIMIDD